MNKKQAIIAGLLFLFGTVAMVAIVLPQEYGVCVGLTPYIPLVVFVFAIVDWKGEMERYEREQAVGGSGSHSSYTRDWPPGGIRRWTRNQLGLNRWRWK